MQPVWSCILLSSTYVFQPECLFSHLFVFSKLYRCVPIREFNFHMSKHHHPWLAFLSCCSSACNHLISLLCNSVCAHYFRSSNCHWIEHFIPVTGASTTTTNLTTTIVVWCLTGKSWRDSWGDWRWQRQKLRRMVWQRVPKVNSWRYCLRHRLGGWGGASMPGSIIFFYLLMGSSFSWICKHVALTLWIRKYSRWVS